MQILKGKCKALPLGGNSPRHQDELGATQLGSSSQKRAWVSWWAPGWMWASNGPLLLRRPMVFWAPWGKVSPAGQEEKSFHSAQHWRGHTWNSIQFWVPKYKKDLNTLQRDQQRAMSPQGTSPLRRSWENWDCSAWRRGGFSLKISFDGISYGTFSLV